MNRNREEKPQEERQKSNVKLHTLPLQNEKLRSTILVPQIQIKGKEEPLVEDVLTIRKNELIKVVKLYQNRKFSEEIDYIEKKGGYLFTTNFSPVKSNPCPR